MSTKATVIKPIETVYNGFKFRSRLEARWAVFFDSLGIKYEYEFEGFELAPGKRYLPDFHIPSFGLHVEVKPNEELSRSDFEKIIRFSVDGDMPLLLIIGSPGNEGMYLVDRRASDGWDMQEASLQDETHEDQVFYFFEALKDWSHVEFGTVPMERTLRLIYKTVDPYASCHFSEAYLAAKQARFEHGQSGVIRRRG